MITSQQALDIILDNTLDLEEEEIPFLKSLGRTLKEDIKADRDFPPFNRVSMDGVAISFKSYQEGCREFLIENIQQAGAEQLSLSNKQHCIEVMTGAVLPKNTDLVIPYELLEIKGKIAISKDRDFVKDQNVHAQANDRAINEVLIKKNSLISAAEIGVFATVGKSLVKVAKQPKVLVVSTGDELVEVNETPASYQIRKSNVYTLVSLLENLNIHVETAHLKDDRSLLSKKIKLYLETNDVILFSGAVSKGKFDFIPEVLEELGVEKKFHQVKQRPGKPFWFGKKGNTCIFAFPGNPVSTFVGCLKYFYPWYKKSAGIVYKNDQKAILAEDFIFKPDLTYFLQVRVENKKGLLLAVPVAGKGSGDLANLSKADAFLELPNDRTDFKTGEIFPLITYRN